MKTIEALILVSLLFFLIWLINDFIGSQLFMINLIIAVLIWGFIYRVYKLFKSKEFKKLWKKTLEDD